MPQYDWLQRGKPQFIGRLENINIDFAILANILNIKTKLQRTNESNTITNLGQLSKKDFRRVAEYYKDDFQATGYSKKYSDF